MSKYILLFLSFLFFLNFIQQQDLLFWNTKRPLTFEDFKYIQKDTIKIENTGRFKAAQSSIHYKYNTSQASYSVPPKIEVLVCFNKKQSWMLLKDEATLEHEQIHFNIHELFARKMRKSIDSLAKLNVCDFKVYNKILDNWEQQPKKYDNLFDAQIDDRVYYLNGKYLSHKDNKKQKFWKEKIDKELKLFENFASAIQ